MPKSTRFPYYREDTGYATPCLIWNRYVGKTGYGEDWLDGRKVSAHRAAWIKAYGPLPAGLFVLHKCDIKRCVRPEHLFVGTQADNMADKVAKDRQARGATHGSRTKPERLANGSKNGAAKLTEKQVLAILRRYRAGGVTQQQLADEYGVDRSAIGLIARGRNWSYLRVAAYEEMA